MRSDSMTAGLSSLRRLWHLPLKQNKRLGALYHVLTFDSPDALPVEPGQFAMVRSQRWGHAPLLSRPMSLMSGGSDPSMLIKVVGEGTAKMAMAEPGEMFSLLAPLGIGFSPCPPAYRPVLIAGGVGVAPLLFLAQRLAALGHEALVFYGGRGESNLPLLDALSRVAEVHLATEDGSVGTRGRVTLLLSHYLDEQVRLGAAGSLKIYACGPDAMMRAVYGLCARAGAACEVSLETPMACGYGVCLGCPVPKASGGFLYACTEGPCVDAARLDWSPR